MERAFVGAINQVIGGREEFLDKLFANIYESLDSIEHEFSEEQINERLAEIQQEIMSMVRLNAKTGLDTGSYDKEYSQLTAELERFRGLRQKLKDEEAQKVIRIQRIDELRQFVQEQETPLVRFDGDLFRRLVEKVSVMTKNEVTFVFKTGAEVKEVMGW